MSWFQNNHEGGHCKPFCPFVRDCASCAFRGGDSSAAQQDSAREARQEMGESGKVALDNKAAPVSALTLPEPRPTAALKPIDRT
jgi:hypothetical protein